MLTRTKTTQVFARLAALTFLSGALTSVGCSDDPPTPPTPAADPKIDTFTAEPLTVMIGGQAVLRWTTTNATKITIAPASGAALLTDSDQVDGSISTGAINAATTFTLTAKNADGKTAVATVNIAVMQAMEDVRIVGFTASKQTVAPNTSVTLSWEVANASGITIREMNGASDLTTSTMQTGTFNTAALTTNTTFILTANGQGGPKTSMVSVAVEGTPVVQTFAAMPQMIELGQSTTLSWNVTGAPAGTTITIRDGANNTLYTGPNATGTQMVTPTANVTYTLTAVTPEMQTVTSNPVMVTVNRAARINAFTANPDTIEYAGTSELRWDTTRADGGIRIEANGAVVHTSALATGAFTVTATRTTQFTLTAINPAGDATAMTTLNISATAPRVVTFDATPAIVRIGERVNLSWSVIAQSSVRLLQGQTEVLTSTSGQGSTSVVITSSVTTFTLEATNPFGTTRDTETTRGQRDARIDTLVVRPITFIGSSTTATITWTTTDALRTELTVNGLAAPGFAGTASGTYTLTTTRTLDLTLRALNDISSATREGRVIRLIGETEAGNTAATPAGALAGDGTGVFGAIRPAQDRDFYTIVVPEGGSVFAETSNGRGGCSFDSVIDLIGPDGTTVVGTDDEDGINSCSQIDPARDAFARNLAAGTYYVVVRPFSTTATFDYTLVARASAPACGNGLVELRANEQCDDGNVVSADGCSATCGAEAGTTLTGPGANQTVAGSITPAAATDFVRIEMLAEGYIYAETFIPADGRCEATSGTADTTLTLYRLEASGAFTLIGADNDDGVGPCSRIDPRFDTFARVPTGTYFLAIGSNVPTQPVNGYVLNLRTVGVGCPNGIIEAPELCDDGNNVNGDGCSSLCSFEGNGEMEPNDVIGSATVVTITSTLTETLVRGEITAEGDIDFFAVNVPAGYHLDAYATVQSIDQCSPTQRVRIEVFNNGGSTIGSNTTGGPQGLCGRMWPYTDVDTRATPGGNYRIRVSVDAASPTPRVLGNYFLHIRTIQPNLCGNTIIETGELCEDGNRTSGDGCTNTCSFEALQVIDLTNPTTATVSGVISPEFNRDAYQLTVTATSVYLTAETFTDAAARACGAGDTTLRLYNAAGTELGTDLDDGVSLCSLIQGGVDTFATLRVGTYWLVVESNANRTQIPRYDLVIRSAARNVCGNRIVEVGNAEECDGQAFCSAACRIVPLQTIVGPPANVNFTGAITPVGDLDFYEVQTSTGAFLRVETGEASIGSCANIDTLIRVFDAATGVQIAVDDDNGPGNCSLLSGFRLRGPGRYFVRVEDFNNDGTIGSYAINISLVGANICGNAVLETAIGETCDDGNTTAGDGCSATCTFEPEGSYTGPGPAQTFTGAVTPVGDTDVYQVTLTAPSILVISGGTPTLGNCPTDDMNIELLGATGALITSDSFSGANFCPLIDGRTRAAARVAAGTYFIRVGELGNDALLTSYELSIQALQQNVCGNGFQETGEQCDDGNLTSGDGCSATCGLEIPIVAEVENNDTPATAQSLSTNVAPGTVINVQGGLTPAADRDFFTFTVTTQVSARIGTYGTANGVLTSCGFDTELWLYNAAPTNFDASTGAPVVAYDDDDGFGACSLINGTNTTPTRITLAPGTYFVQVAPYNNGSAIANYFLNLDFQ